VGEVSPSSVVRGRGRRAAVIVVAAVAVVALLVWLLPPAGGFAVVLLALIGSFVAVPALLLRGRLRRALGGLGGFVLFVGLLALVLRLRFGGGEPYPDLTTEPRVPDAALEAAVTSDEPIGNVAVTPEGRIFYTIHPESRPEGARLLEWNGKQGVPWPSAELQDGLGPILGLAVDGRGRLWTIGHGLHGVRAPTLFAFELATGRVAHEHAFTDAELGSFYQDLEVSHDGRTVYIADASFWRRRPAIVVYDAETQQTVRRLAAHASVYPQRWIIRTPAKDMVFFGGVVALQTGLDGIVLSHDDAWLYYAAMSHDTLFRVKTAELRDPGLSDADLAARVEAIGKKPLSDGIGIDAEGNVLVTDVEHGAIVRVAPSGAAATLVKTPRIRWADGVTFGPDGWLYIADSDIPDQMLQSKAHIREHAPYHVWRLRPDIGGVAGR